MSWNYRVVKHEDTLTDGNEIYYAIHECYYDENDIPTSITSGNGIELWGDTLEELKEDLRLMTLALDKPILNYKDF